jgi:hypothetical protein
VRLRVLAGEEAEAVRGVRHLVVGRGPHPASRRRKEEREAMSWVESIRKGDIIEGDGGLLRVVRDVKHWRTRRGKVHTTVTLAIRRPSWTRRPYTVINCHDLKYRGYRPTGKTWPLDSEFDKELESTFRREPPCGRPNAWDVLGVA